MRYSIATAPRQDQQPMPSLCINLRPATPSETVPDTFSRPFFPSSLRFAMLSCTTGQHLPTRVVVTRRTWFSIQAEPPLLHPNSKLLVNELEALPALDGRFTGLHLVNMPNGEKRGNFSLVFKAFDRVEGRYVALKFFDLDPSKMDPFRLACFDREHSLLTKLLGAARCLQVLSPLSVYNFQINGFTVPAKYFVTEWHDADIDEFFLRQDHSKAILKLRLFNEVVLAVEVLHKANICHRDIKANNFRRSDINSIDGVVIIDLGTAALFTSPPFATRYSGPVGLTMYSAPESFCGLAGNRSIAYLTDIYALGCMLFELFAEDDFWTAYNVVNPDFTMRLAALRHALAQYRDEKTLLEHWNIHAQKLLAGLSPLQFTRDESSAPAPVLDIVNDLIAKLTAPNFHNRSITLAVLRQRIWSAIRCLENDAVARKRAERMAIQRNQRKEQARLKGQRAVRSRLAHPGEGNGSH